MTARESRRGTGSAAQNDDAAITRRPVQADPARSGFDPRECNTAASLCCSREHSQRIAKNTSVPAVPLIAESRTKCGSRLERRFNARLGSLSRGRGTRG